MVLFYNCESCQICHEMSPIFIYIHVGQRCVILAFSFDVFLGLKDFLSHVTGGAFNEILSRLSCGSLANSMWYGNFFWLKRSSTFMTAWRVSTAASVSSVSTFSGMPDILRLSRRPWCSNWSSLAFCSMIVHFKGLISLFLVSSSSFNVFNCLCILLEIGSANSWRLGWIICFSWLLISGDLRAAAKHKIKWSRSILSWSFIVIQSVVEPDLTMTMLWYAYAHRF